MEVEEDVEFDCDFYKDNPQILAHALSSSQCFQTMRVAGQHGMSSLHILIDVGNTHNFLDIDIVKKLGCEMEPIQFQAVAYGNKLFCQYVSKGFKWQLHNSQYMANVLLISLGRCDMVLRVQWLFQLGTI